MGLCYCPNTLREFRLWLREKYPKISDLNHIWITNYGEWDEVEPRAQFAMLPPYIDFRYFMDDVYLSSCCNGGPKRSGAATPCIAGSWPTWEDLLSAVRRNGAMPNSSTCWVVHVIPLGGNWA